MLHEPILFQLLRRRHLPVDTVLSGGCILQSGETWPLVLNRVFGKIGITLPAAEAAKELAIQIAGVLTPAASTAVTLAMTPLAIVFVFRPTARQLYATAFPAHIAVFPADVSIGPSSTLSVWTFAEAY